jgi:hypothetical protein
MMIGYFHFITKNLQALEDFGSNPKSFDILVIPEMVWSGLCYVMLFKLLYDMIHMLL